MDSKFPPPDPSRLQSLPPEVTTVATGMILFRIYSPSGRFPTTWNAFRFYGPVASSRFDHHLEPPSVQARGVLYAACDLTTCIAEVFQDRRIVDLHHGVRHLAAFRLLRPLRLLDVRRNWITRAGASAAISSGDRSIARAWSRCFYDAYPLVDGIVYSSSMNPGADAIALYERGQDAVPRTPAIDIRLDHPAMARGVADSCRALGYRVG